MDLRLAVRLTLALALGGLAMWLVALFVGLSSGSVNAAIVLRTLLTVAMLLFVTRLLVRGAYDVPGRDRSVAVAAVASYALSPAAWSGRALVAQLAVDPGPVTVAADLVIWVAVVVVAGRTVTRRQADPGHLPYQSA